MIESVLSEIGLTQNEIKIYLALLKLGKSKTGELLKEANLNSGRVYETLDSLQKKGLVSYIIESNIKYFSPADPKQILDYLEEKKENIEKQKKEYSKVLPELMGRLSQLSDDVKVEVFIGLKGLRNAFEKEIKRYETCKEVYVMGLVHSSNYSKIVARFFTNEVYKERKIHNVVAKKILSIDANNDEIIEKDANVRYLPFSSMMTTNIIDDLTILSINTETHITITIENSAVSKSFKENFEMLWKIAKE